MYKYFYEIDFPKPDNNSDKQFKQIYMKDIFLYAYQTNIYSFLCTR